MKMLKIKTGVDHTLSARDLTKKTLSIEKKFAYPFLLRTGYRHRVSSSKGNSSGGGSVSKGNSSGGGFDFDSPINQTLRSTGLFDGTQHIVKHSPQNDRDYEDDSDSSLYSEVEVSPTRENTFSVEKGILNKASMDNMNLAENGNHSIDIEDVEMNDPFLIEPSRSHISKNSIGSNFYSKIVNDT